MRNLVSFAHYDIVITERSYHHWTKEETEELRDYFKAWVEDVSKPGAKGRLPGNNIGLSSKLADDALSTAGFPFNKNSCY